ncbi:MAG: PepSY-associated TM helix domain-containing protein [Pseudomonadota bacterium]
MSARDPVTDPSPPDLVLAEPSGASGTNRSHLPGLSRRIAQLHRWVGLLLGLQVMLWMLSGVIMTWIPFPLVKSKPTTALVYPAELSVQVYASPGGILAQTPGATQISLQTFQGKPVYVTEGNNQDHLFDAISGKKISPLRKDQALAVANADYAGDAPVRHVRLMTKTPGEFRGKTPVWQVEFRDPNATRLYISPFTGEVLTRRNNYWRLFDFFWMLHIMDYEEREDFNNPLLRIAAGLGLVFALSGLILVALRFAQGRFWRRRSSASS